MSLVTLLEELNDCGFFRDLILILAVELWRNFGIIVLSTILSPDWYSISHFRRREPPSANFKFNKPIHPLRSVKHLSILDSLMTFSRYGPHDLHSSNYHRLSRMYGSLKLSEVDQGIASQLDNLGTLSGVLNSHLQKLSIEGFNLVHFFVLQNDTETSPIMLPPLIRPTLQLTHDILDDHTQLLERIERNIAALKQIKVKCSDRGEALILLRGTLDLVQRARYGLEDCCQSLRLYPLTVHFANKVGNSSGQSRLKATLARGLEIIQDKNLDHHSQLAAGCDIPVE
ncbi:hypothetical protein MJO28_017686 [Puccinia striiformis f. sp. tritici]|nr:hypothetical protein MJO28_017686 [Puccinia striiformis f. sp. tritici]